MEHWLDNCVSSPAAFQVYIRYSRFPSPIIGGVLSNPAIRWPNTLGHVHFLRVHPYFLPCAVSGFIALATFIISFMALKEVSS